MSWRDIEAKIGVEKVFANISTERIISAPDADLVYQVPLDFEGEEVVYIDEYLIHLLFEELINQFEIKSVYIYATFCVKPSQNSRTTQWPLRE